MLKEHKRIIFNGNNYSEDWRKDAAKRGLLNLTNTVAALPEMVKPPVVKLFEKFKVMNERELHARFDVAVETYIKTINIEAQLMTLMADRYILPAVLRYQREVADSVSAVKDAGGSTREAKKMLDRVTGLVDEFRVRTDKLVSVVAHQDGDPGKHAQHMRDQVVVAMNNLRETGDQIELLVPHEMWPLPTYREMLFIK
jgi:glutamine synthetase